jgi:hypothetical protein
MGERYWKLLDGGGPGKLVGVRARHKIVQAELEFEPAREITFAEFRRIRKTLWGKALIKRGAL